MEPRQSEDGYEEEGDDDHDYDGDDCRDSLQLLCLLVIEDVDEAEDKDADHVKREGNEEHEEVAVVSPTWDISCNCELLLLKPTYAIVDPGAVVVKDLDAVVADGTVTAPRRPIELTSDTPCCRSVSLSARDLARDTPLHPHCDSVDLHVAVQRSSEIIVSVFVRTGARYHLRNGHYTRMWF